jgi:hypothetical protein
MVGLVSDAPSRCVRRSLTSQVSEGRPESEVEEERPGVAV